jgi:serine/threonine protein kinase
VRNYISLRPHADLHQRQMEQRSFQRLEELHRSAGGVVWLARHCSTGQRVVIKERHAAELGRNKEIAHELSLYEKLPQHPNLVRYLGSFWNGSSGRHAGKGSVLSMVFEHATGGDLHEALQQQRRSGRYLSERQVLQWFVPIVAGALHLHTHGVVHRDLKSLNVVLHDGRPKICDLGISRERSTGAAGCWFASYCSLSDSRVAHVPQHGHHGSTQPLHNPARTFYTHCARSPLAVCRVYVRKAIV